MTDASTDPEGLLALADWRRAISELYAQVRTLAETDPSAARDHWVAVRERLYRKHPVSPVPAARRAEFVARHWPYDPALRFAAPVRAIPPDPAGRGGGSRPRAARLVASAGDAMHSQAIGTVEIRFPDGLRHLTIYWLSGYAGGVFLPFGDATNGGPTYAAGRYLLDTAKGADLGRAAGGELILDFNFAFHPSCAFDPQWACPLAPPENRIDLTVEAGERLE